MKTECKHSLDVSPSGQMATCSLCGFVGRWRDGAWAKVDERAPVPPAPADPTTPGPWKVAGVAWEVASGVWTRHIYTAEFVRGVVLGHQARGRTEAEVQANALLISAAPDMLQMLRDIDAHFAAHFGEQAWATSEIGGMTRVTIAKATGVAVLDDEPEGVLHGQLARDARKSRTTAAGGAP